MFPPLVSPSDIWSWSSFRVTVHASWVLMSAKQSIVYWGLTHLQSLIKVTFCCKYWLHSLDMTLFEWFSLWPRMAFKCLRNFRLSPWIYYLIDYFSYLPVFDKTATLLWSAGNFILRRRQFVTEVRFNGFRSVLLLQLRLHRLDQCRLLLHHGLQRTHVHIIGPFHPRVAVCFGVFER